MVKMKGKTWNKGNGIIHVISNPLNNVWDFNKLTKEERKNNFIIDLIEVFEKVNIQNIPSWLNPIQKALDNDDRNLLEFVNQPHYIDKAKEVYHPQIKQFQVLIYVSECDDIFEANIRDYYELLFSKLGENDYCCELSKKRLVWIYKDEEVRNDSSQC